jgi:hypothetical protein
VHPDVVRPARLDDGAAGAVRSPSGHQDQQASGAGGRALRVRIEAATLRGIQRARGATAALTIRYADATGARHQVAAKLRLLPRR